MSALLAAEGLCDLRHHSKTWHDLMHLPQSQLAMLEHMEIFGITVE
jgi:hypothetical protein